MTLSDARRIAAMIKAAAEAPIDLPADDTSKITGQMTPEEIQHILGSLGSEQKYLDRETTARAPKPSGLSRLLTAGGGAVGLGVLGAKLAPKVFGRRGGGAAGVRLVEAIKGAITTLGGGTGGLGPLEAKFAPRVGRLGGGAAGVGLGAVLGEVITAIRRRKMREPVMAELTTRMPERMALRMMRGVDLPTQLAMAADLQRMASREHGRVKDEMKRKVLERKPRGFFG